MERKNKSLLLIASIIIIFFYNYILYIKLRNWNNYKGILFNYSNIKKRLTYIKVLEVICMLSIIVTIYSMLTYSQANISSDEAMQSFLMRTILEKRSLFPKEWAYAMGDIWVISTHTFILPFIFLKNQILARVLGNVLLFLVTLWGIYYHDKKMFKNNSYLISIPLFLVFLNGNQAIITMRIDGMYTIYMLFIVILLTKVILIYKKVINNEKEKYYFLQLLSFIFLIFLLTITGIRMIAYFIIPLCLTFFFFYYTEVKNKENFKIIKNKTLKYLKLISIIIIPSILGVLIHIWIVKTHITNNKANSLIFIKEFKDIRLNLFWYIDSILENFGFRFSAKLISLNGIKNIISVSFSLIVMLVIPIFQIRKLRNETLETRLFCIFGFFHILILFIIIVFLGQTRRMIYTLTTIYICILISARYIMSYCINKKNINTKFIIFCFSICSLIQIEHSITLSKGWISKLENKKYISKQLLKHGLYKGYSGFWNAYSNNLYSNYKLKISGLIIREDAVIAYKWLNDISWFNEEKNIKTFLLLTEKENEILKHRLEIQFGSPIDKFMIDKYYVYVFNYDIAINLK